MQTDGDILKVKSASYLFASEPHKNISHDALPLTSEHTFLESVKQLKMLLDQKPERARKWTRENKRRKRTNNTR